MIFFSLTASERNPSVGLKVRTINDWKGSNRIAHLADHIDGFLRRWLCAEALPGFLFSLFTEAPNKEMKEREEPQ
jgi:hypothetical protein